MKLIKKIVVVMLVLAALVYFVAIPYVHRETKKFSPYKTSVLELDNTVLKIDYSSPSKKGRKIFGELVPYGNVWRTGANEPTTITVSKPIKIIDKPLPAGTYSLWSIPNKKSWKIMFNTQIPDWGVTRINGNQTTHDSNYDLITVEVPVIDLQNPVEDFTITFEEQTLQQKSQNVISLAWDTTKIMVPVYK
ncbi:DUF2911 domain-containing protein [Maribacter confluentis]|uniref:DUF2911 domain-containing protein n=1 Tax=Maribacter confluentis TaxID=1656093 RepID=A0ABT8RT26_9FLAO|nr:DUF2911 domain-containing protein [Maribacter confluentis]MDO1514071.1 DUF2911 domain-containing protein [Maribacter confluentis]